MKRLFVVFILLTVFVTTIECLTYKPLYVGESKCYEFHIRNQDGTDFDPNAGDVMKLILRRTATSTPDLLTVTGLYTSGGEYTFVIDSDETTGLATGDALFYLELSNVANKVQIVINDSKITIKR